MPRNRIFDTARQRPTGMPVIGQATHLRSAVTGVDAPHRETGIGGTACPGALETPAGGMPDRPRTPAPADAATVRTGTGTSTGTSTGTVLPGAETPQEYPDNLTGGKNAVTEIHIPASPTRAFANMLFFLIHSLAHRAVFPGSWRVVITLGRDGDLGPDAPEFAWARDFPVVFRQADRDIWAACQDQAVRRKSPGFIYNATILAQFAQAFDADIVVFMDADTVVVRAFDDLIARVAQTGQLAAKPAWQPPPVDLAPILAAAGLAGHAPAMPYSGYGWTFVEPRLGPPYYNGGFVVCPHSIANEMRRDMPRDFDFVTRHYHGHYIWQIAHCLTLLRNATPCLDLDERYNMGIGAPGPSILPGADGAALDALGQAQFDDTRVLHYCTPTPGFVRNTTMADPAALAGFLAATGLDEGEQLLQDSFAPYAAEWAAALGPATV